MTMRRLLGPLLGCLLLGALLVPVTPSGAAQGTGDLERAACTLADDELLRIWRGWRQDRGGDLIVVPREPNYLGRGFPHAGPWDYLQHVPMFWYGPGFIKARGSVSKPVTLADIAPTEGAILHYPFPAPDGKVLRTALEPKAKRKDPPKLIVTLVWDAGGRDVLDAHPRSWPYLESLIDKGTWFENATVGSAQSDTPPAHATIGTGAFPLTNGVLDQHMRINGDMVTPWGNGPITMIVPTLADLYDRAMDNKPIVGGLASLGAHLGALSHGSMWGGGDRDIAVNRENTGDEGDEGIVWNLRDTIKPYFKFPRYVNKLPTFTDYLKEVDALDGSMDGAWRGHDFQTDPKMRFGWDTPARIWQQTKLITTVIKREKFGKDNVPDLLFLNYKAIDNVGHGYSINSIEMQDTVEVQDQNLKILVSYLNKRVGEGEWAMVVTADHGHQLDPAVSGAYPIDNVLLEEKLNERFNGGIQEIRPTQIWLRASAANDAPEISRYIMGLTEGDIPSKDVPSGNDTMFQAVFPAVLMKKLPCMKDALKKAGESLHPERDVVAEEDRTTKRAGSDGGATDPGTTDPGTTDPGADDGNPFN